MIGLLKNTLLLAINLLYFQSQAQLAIPIASESIARANRFYIDNYNHIYIANRDTKTLSKYDNNGQPIAQQMQNSPTVLQPINNPLNLVLFSENTQQITLLDSQLNTIQNINLLTNFGFIKKAFVEDLQHLWLLDDTTKNLIQYNYRNNKIINNFPLYTNFDDIYDFFVQDNKIYFLREKKLEILSLRGNSILKLELNNPLYLKRENDKTIVFTTQETFVINDNFVVKKLNIAEGLQIVDKNQSGYLVRSQNKLYLYPLEPIKGSNLSINNLD